MGFHGTSDEGGAFWGEIAPCDHILQLYREDDDLLDALEGFAAGGLRRGDGVIIVATPDHGRALEDRLRRRAGMDRTDLDSAILEDRYIAFDAETLLSRFMVGGWPDEGRFKAEIGKLLARARGDGGSGGPRRVRAFGEMVAVLWAQGCTGATVQLEYLWHAVCEAERLSLFCAYPRIGFTEGASDSARTICELHSKLMSA